MFVEEYYVGVECFYGKLDRFFGEIAGCVMISDGYRPSSRDTGREEGLPQLRLCCATSLGNFRSGFEYGQSHLSEAAEAYDQSRDFQVTCAFSKGDFSSVVDELPPFVNYHVVLRQVVTKWSAK